VRWPSRKRVVVVIVGAALLYTAFDWVKWRERSDRATGVAITLQPATQVVRIGKRPELHVMLTNHGRGDVVLVEPGDGSRYGLRTPVIAWSDDWWFRTSQWSPIADGRCGWMNIVEASEVFVLKAGESRELPQWAGRPHATAPGRYVVSLSYSNDPSIAASTVDEATKDRMRSSTAVSTVSNSVEIIVVE